MTPSFPSDPPASVVAGHGGLPAERDLAVDLARVFAVVVVVTTHLLMVGVRIDPVAGIVISQPLTSQSWFPVATLFLQIMPLFFVLGGFASLTGWRSLEGRGGSSADYIRSRIARLVRPAIVVFVFFAVAINAALLADVPAGFVDGVVAGIGTPLWFLAAYVLCQWCVPFMARLHAEAPVGTLAGLAAAAVGVDAVRFSTGLEPVGLLNMAFVWLFVQQLGFLYADGWFFRFSRGAVVAIGSSAILVLAALVLAGLYVPDMLANLNPPTVPLMLLGVIQLCVLVLSRSALARLMRRRTPRAVVFLFGSRLMTIYLWHMIGLVSVTGATLLIPGAAPDPATAAWWASRPLMLIATFALVLLWSRVVGRFETAPVRPRRNGEEVSLSNATLAAAAVFVPMLYVTRFGLDGYAALAAALLLPAALWLVQPRASVTGRAMLASGRMG
ncbi:acyltransferase [Rathayibacter sp. YIM 133350]|uniref:acyltransferase family protein n=1 Tax=Rathayibacter sp. YIM 133350 TaxID=3131992 RepID=UPI00307D9AD9